MLASYWLIPTVYVTGRRGGESVGKVGYGAGNVGCAYDECDSNASYGIGCIGSQDVHEDEDYLDN